MSAKLFRRFGNVAMFCAFVISASIVIIAYANCAEALGQGSRSANNGSTESAAAQYRGVWNSEPNRGPACKASDYGSGRFDSLLKVEANSVSFFEVVCNIERYKAAGPATSEVQLTCKGDGLRWHSKEVWHQTKLRQDRMLIRMSQMRYDLRDDFGRRLPDERDPQVITYVGCRG